MTTFEGVLIVCFCAYLGFNELRWYALNKACQTFVEHCNAIDAKGTLFKDRSDQKEPIE